MKTKINSGEYKITNKRGRSEVWNIFGPLINDKGEEILTHLVGCKTCNNVYKYSKNGTSNLTKHKCFVMAKKEINPKYVEVSQEQKKFALKSSRSGLLQAVALILWCKTLAYKNIQSSYYLLV